MSFPHRKRPSLITSAHIVLLVIGTAIFTLFAFNKNIWFDEAYTIGLVRHGVADIFKLHIYDVHPFLYYFLLKIFTFVFGSSLLSMRLFSVIGAVMLSLLGLTHIRRDFGEKVGFWFSFFSVFCASTLYYAEQIRMYSWATFFVALAGIYAYRLGKNDGIKNSALFVLFSVCAAYTHYFALFAVAAVNIVLLVHKIRQKQLFRWFATAALQIVLYIPGALIFLKQATAGGASWIKLSFPENVFDTLAYPFLGEKLIDILGKGSVAYYAVGSALVAVFLAAVLLLFFRCHSLLCEKPFRFSAEIIFGVIAFSVLVSLFRPIYYERYTVVLYGFLFFLFARAVSEAKAWTRIAAAVLTVAVFAVQVHRISTKCFDETSGKVETLLENKLQRGDIVVSSSIDIYCFSVFSENCDFYFYNKGEWNVENAYRAFGDNTVVIRDLNIPEITENVESVWVLNDKNVRDFLIANGFCEKERVSERSSYRKEKYTFVRFEKVNTD